MGPGSTQSGATPFRPPTQPNQPPRSQLTSVCRGPPGPIIPRSLRFFSVCQVPEAHLKSSSSAVCPWATPLPRDRSALPLSCSWPCFVPNPSWGPHPWPGLAPLLLPTECVFRRVTRSQTASPPASSTIFSLRASSTRSLARGRSPDLGPAPCVLLGPPASSGAVSVRLSSAQSFLGPPGPTGSSADPGEPARHLPLFCAVLTLTATVRGTTQGLRAASTCSPVHGCNPGLGPVPCVLLGPPASSDTAFVRLSRARSPLGPQAPAGTSAATGEPARRLPLLCAVRALSTSIRATTQGRGLCRVLRPTDSEVPDGQIPALPELPRRPTHARPPPLVLPRSLDLNRPGEGSLPTLYSLDPPELTIQACAIFRSLATPPLLICSHDGVPVVPGTQAQAPHASLELFSCYI
ncbi:hypothetical protein NDU88_001312 [Pleurodeles waltl]|uniref:Uncharacterized protein n=1 Tax=Pleurodeles waltl TaxID=8319 RepID=A0AAV7MJC9_PLEWA|nr:hypothetical protein NDU88_001312 [Pleurodeles waltl]